MPAESVHFSANATKEELAQQPVANSMVSVSSRHLLGRLAEEDIVNQAAKRRRLS
jgi:hypothetical protein